MSTLDEARDQPGRPPVWAADRHRARGQYRPGATPAPVALSLQLWKRAGRAGRIASGRPHAVMWVSARRTRPRGGCCGAGSALGRPRVDAKRARPVRRSVRGHRPHRAPRATANARRVRASKKAFQEPGTKNPREHVDCWSGSTARGLSLHEDTHQTRIAREHVDCWSGSAARGLSLHGNTHQTRIARKHVD